MNAFLFRKSKPALRIDQLPPVESGFPVPPPNKRHARGRPRMVSPWIAYLKKLKPGQSFKTQYPTVHTVKRIATLHSIPIRWRDLPSHAINGMREVRVWRSQ